ncbi:hypothetical protein [Vibrio tetraodonis]|uniref:hypothetical protein n=1 Tax=Vibrio tetraodonis TaxID=2231647 RepID=UPI00356A58A1
MIHFVNLYSKVRHFYHNFTHAKRLRELFCNKLVRMCTLQFRDSANSNQDKVFAKTDRYLNT